MIGSAEWTDFTWALCMATCEEGILYAASIEKIKGRVADDDRAGKGHEERKW